MRAGCRVRLRRCSSVAARCGDAPCVTPCSRPKSLAAPSALIYGMTSIIVRRYRTFSACCAEASSGYGSYALTFFSTLAGSGRGVEGQRSEERLRGPKSEARKSLRTTTKSDPSSPRQLRRDKRKSENRNPKSEIGNPSGVDPGVIPMQSSERELNVLTQRRRDAKAQRNCMLDGFVACHFRLGAGW